MREIKFRFVKEDGTFSGDVALIKGKPYREVNPTDNKFVRVFDDRGHSTDYYNNWATYKIAKDIIDINMYTGLKDYNGKDVYEGDLIQDIDYGIMECKYLHGSFVWYSKNGFNIKLMNYIPNIEVIGNIYENPELLLEK